MALDVTVSAPLALTVVMVEEYPPDMRTGDVGAVGGGEALGATGFRAPMLPQGMYAAGRDPPPPPPPPLLGMPCFGSLEESASQTPVQAS